MQWLSSALILLLSAIAVASDGDSFIRECATDSETIPFAYCIHKPESTGSTDFIYYLHGSNMSEMTWSEEFYYTAQIRAEWARNGVAMPTVVSVSFGSIWLLAEPNSSAHGGLLPVFEQVVIPKIEAALGGVKGRRIVLGESMGGFNSLQLALKTRLFKKAAILCAPMADLSPFSDQPAIDAYIQKSTAWHYYKDSNPQLVRSAVAEILGLVKAFFPRPAEWALADPLALAEGSSALDAPRLYVAAGYYDRFAAYEGNQMFAA